MKMFACDFFFLMCIFIFENESVACHYYFRILQCVYLDWECIMSK